MFRGKLYILLIMWDIKASHRPKMRHKFVFVGLVPFGVISLRSFRYIWRLNATSNESKGYRAMDKAKKIEVGTA